VKYHEGTTAAGKPLPGAPTKRGIYTVVASFGGSQDYTSASSTATFADAKEAHRGRRRGGSLRR
jgi:hypothetical protein